MLSLIVLVIVIVIVMMHWLLSIRSDLPSNPMPFSLTNQVQRCYNETGASFHQELQNFYVPNPQGIMIKKIQSSAIFLAMPGAPLLSERY